MPNNTKHAWFNEARYGLFLHWGPYSVLGRGEQVLMREHLDQRDYASKACQWNPAGFDAREWARMARRSGFRYAVLTTRHHDGYCLWDSRLTNYTSAAQAPRRDFVAEYVRAFRAEGLRVGLYYSLGDWRIPALFDGPAGDPAGWDRFRDYCHGQVRELLSSYGPIDVFWFDGAWPRSAGDWRAAELVAMIRALQPGILVNNRLGASTVATTSADGGQGAGGDAALGDFGTPEHAIIAEARPWESCQVSTWRLWGWAPHERFRPADLLLDMLCECAEKGGNLLLNVAPDGDGRIPAAFVDRASAIGDWLARHGEAIYGAHASDRFIEAVTFGRVTRKGDTLYLIIRFYPPDGVLRLPGLATDIATATLLTTGQRLPVARYEGGWVLTGLPAESPDPLFPVIRLELAGPPARLPWFVPGQWTGDPRRYRSWAAARGVSFDA